MGEKRTRNSTEEELYYSLPYLGVYSEAILEALFQTLDENINEDRQQIAQNYDKLITQLDEDVQIEEETELADGDCLEDDCPSSPFPEFPSVQALNTNKLKEVGIESAWHHPYREVLMKKLSRKYRASKRVSTDSRHRDGSKKYRKSNRTSSLAVILESNEHRLLPSVSDVTSPTTPFQIGPHVIRLPDDTPLVPNATERSSVFSTSSPESLAPVAEQEVEPRLLQFMAENPLGRTCLPIRFQQLMNDIPEDSVLREESRHIDNPEHDPSTPGVVVMLSTPERDGIAHTPKAPKTPSITPKQPAQTGLPSKSPSVRDLISVFSRHQTTPLSKTPSRFNKTPHSNARPIRISRGVSGPTPPLNNTGKVMITPGEVPPPSQSESLYPSQTNAIPPRPPLSGTISAIQKVSFTRGRPPLERTPPIVQPKGDTPMDAIMVSNPPSEERRKSNRDDPENSVARTSLEYSSVREEILSIGRPTPDFATGHHDHDSEEHDEDIPVPTDNPGRCGRITTGQEKESVTATQDENERHDTMSEGEDNADGDTGSKEERDVEAEDRGEEDAIVQEEESCSASPSPSREMVRKRFLSVDPNATNELLKHGEDLGLDVLRRRGEPKNIEILVHPGQQKRQKAKDINWVPGVVQRVQFRGDENTVMKWQEQKRREEKESEKPQNGDEQPSGGRSDATVDQQSDHESSGVNRRQDESEQGGVIVVVDEDDEREDVEEIDRDDNGSDEDDGESGNDGDDDSDDYRSSDEYGREDEKRDRERERSDEEGVEEDSERSRRSSELIMSSSRWNKENVADDNLKNQNHPAYILSNLQPCTLHSSHIPTSKSPMTIAGGINQQHPAKPATLASTKNDKEFIEPMSLRKSPTGVYPQNATLASALTSSANRLLSASGNRLNLLSGSRGCGDSAIPRRPANITALSLSAIQQQTISKFEDENGSKQESGDSATGAGIPRLTPRAPPAKKRMHRFLKKIGDKNWNDQADLSEDEGEVGRRTGIRASSWARHTSNWHQKVKQQSHIDPITIFGCGVRPVEFRDVFKTPDFHRAYRDLPIYQQHRHQNANPKEMITREGRAEKVKKWTQDKRQCGFGDHEGVTMYEVLRFRERVGRHGDVSHMVWDCWTLCGHDCEHNSTTRQPWFQQIGASPSPYRLDSGPSPGMGSASSTARRRLWGSPLPSSRWLENVEEGDEDACRGASRSPPPNYLRGLFWNSMGKPKPPVPPINLPVSSSVLTGLTPKNSTFNNNSSGVNTANASNPTGTNKFELALSRLPGPSSSKRSQTPNQQKPSSIVSSQSNSINSTTTASTTNTNNHQSINTHPIHSQYNNTSATASQNSHRQMFRPDPSSGIRRQQQPPSTSLSKSQTSTKPSNASSLSSSSSSCTTRPYQTQQQQYSSFFLKSTQ